MRRALTRRLAAVGAAMSAVLGSAALAAEITPLDRAREAAGRTSFSGLVEVEWHDGSATRRQTVRVEGGGGVVRVHGSPGMIAYDHVRLGAEGSALSLLWTAGAPERPSLGDKYQVTMAPGDSVLGRSTSVVEVRAAGALVERLVLDQRSGLVLRREHLDSAGVALRSLGFTELVVETEDHPLPRPGTEGLRPPGPLGGARDLPAWSSAPRTLAGGYHKLTTVRQEGVVHAVYSDGLYDLSVFEQPGRLRAPPGGRAVRVGRWKGHHYVWPGGQIVMWQAGDAVYTAVGDGPYADVLAASGEVGAGNDDPSILSGLRRACRNLVGALSGEA